MSFIDLFGGERGIRTLDTRLAYTRFPGVRLQPLGHLSDTHIFMSKQNFYCFEPTTSVRLISYFPVLHPLGASVAWLHCSNSFPMNLSTIDSAHPVLRYSVPLSHSLKCPNSLINYIHVIYIPCIPTECPISFQTKLSRRICRPPLRTFIKIREREG